jgi:hypothetical protein
VRFTRPLCQPHPHPGSWFGRTDTLKQAGCKNVLRAANVGEFPREGKFHGFGGGEYYIHGCGCRVIAKELEIDFDFDASGDISGFDAWKLYDYARNHAEAYGWVTTRDKFEILIKLQIKSGSLKNAPPPASNLLYWKLSSKKGNAKD